MIWCDARAEGTGDAYEPAASAAGDDYAPDPTEFAEIDDSAVDAMVALASPVVHNPAHLALFARASSAIELSVGAERTLGAAAVGPSAAEGYATNTRTRTFFRNVSNNWACLHRASRRLP